MERTWFVALRVVLQAIDKIVEIFLSLFAVLERSALEFGVIALWRILLLVPRVSNHVDLQLVKGRARRTRKSSSSVGVR